jgi:hypothetical protein
VRQKDGPELLRAASDLALRPPKPAQHGRTMPTLPSQALAPNVLSSYPFLSYAPRPSSRQLGATGLGEPHGKQSIMDLPPTGMAAQKPEQRRRSTRINLSLHLDSSA